MRNGKWEMGKSGRDNVCGVRDCEEFWVKFLFGALISFFRECFFFLELTGFSIVDGAFGCKFK